MQIHKEIIKTNKKTNSYLHNCFFSSFFSFSFVGIQRISKLWTRRVSIYWLVSSKNVEPKNVYQLVWTESQTKRKKNVDILNCLQFHWHFRPVFLPLCIVRPILYIFCKCFTPISQSETRRNIVEPPTWISFGYFSLVRCFLQHWIFTNYRHQVSNEAFLLFFF